MKLNEKHLYYRAKLHLPKPYLFLKQINSLTKSIETLHCFKMNKYLESNVMDAYL